MFLKELFKKICYKKMGEERVCQIAFKSKLLKKGGKVAQKNVGTYSANYGTKL